MPTASAHLAAALDLLDDPALAARQQLASGEPHSAFLLGTVSPDVRVVNGLAREETHFYNIPVSQDRPASQTLLSTYPTLAKAAALPLSQAAFVAGYMAHLVMDEAWLECVVMPYIFIDNAEWGSHHPKYRLYSLLMTYLAEQGGRRMTPALAQSLRAAQPDNWLPFASDADLLAWRERVLRYAMTDSGRLTARMFAHQMGIQADELYSIVTSQEAMEREVFSAMPRRALEKFRSQTHQRCIAALDAYLAPAAV